MTLEGRKWLIFTRITRGELENLLGNPRELTRNGAKPLVDVSNRRNKLSLRDKISSFRSPQMNWGQW